jgi:geranylgeranyl diphosphate synthase type I
VPLADLASEYVPAIDAEMSAVLDERPEPLDLYDYLRYHLGWVDEDFQPLAQPLQRRYGGKRLRPILCLLAYRSVREDWQRALPAAAAVELIQNFTLIHDDVEDNDPERRHRPTLWRLWGVPQAINAGSCMQALVNRAVFRLADQGVPERHILLATRILTDCILELTEGQYLDISFESRFEVTLEQYFSMANRKTGALMEAATWLGALLAGGDEETIAAWRALGRSFGLAFQARDDLLGIWEKAEATGKAVAGDILKRKMSLPIVYALTHAPTSDRQAILTVYSQLETRPADVKRVVQVLDRCDARAYCVSVVQQHTAAAQAALDRLPDCPSVAKARGLVRLVAAV